MVDTSPNGVFLVLLGRCLMLLTSENTHKGKVRELHFGERRFIRMDPPEDQGYSWRD
jgi:hypothetical protein